MSSEYDEYAQDPAEQGALVRASSVNFAERLKRRQVAFILRHHPHVGAIGAAQFQAVWAKAREMNLRAAALVTKRGRYGARDAAPTILADAISLIRECKAFGPPKRLVDLVQTLCAKQLPAPLGRTKKNRPALTKKKWKALFCEAKRFKFIFEEGGPLSIEWKQSPALIAKLVRVSVRSVHKWRDREDYRQGLIVVLVRLNRPVSEPSREAPETIRGIELGRLIKSTWVGPIASILDGRTYNDPDEYFLHIESRGAALVKPRSELKR